MSLAAGIPCPFINEVAFVFGSQHKAPMIIDLPPFCPDAIYSQVQCVQVDITNFSSTCPCGEVSFSFSVVGDTSVVDNVVSKIIVHNVVSLKGGLKTITQTK